MPEKKQQISQDVSSVVGFQGVCVVPGTKLRYKKSLISKYCSEHRSILDRYHDAFSAYQAGDDLKFRQKLEALQIELSNHLIDEALNMYVYLKHYYAKDEKKLNLIRRFNRNVKKSGITVFSFVKRFTEAGEAIIHDQDFLAQLIQIGNSLEVHLAAEERYLFHLYRRPEGA